MSSKKYHILKFSGLLGLLLLSACSSQETSNNTVKTSYYLAPAASYDTQVDLGDSDVQLLGNLKFSPQNKLYTGADNIPLALYYDSSDTSDGYSALSSWRHTYTRSMDRYNHVDYDALRKKSPQYDSKQEACSAGFKMIKDEIYNGAFKGSNAVLDSTNDLCSVQNAQGETLLTLPLFANRAEQNFHTLSREDGTTLIFIEGDDEDSYHALNNPVLTLEKAADTWVFTDDQDIKETYNTSGLLVKRMIQGQTLNFEYDDNEQLIKIYDEFNHDLTFTYDDQGTLLTLSNNQDNIINVFENNASHLKGTHLKNGSETLKLFSLKYDKASRLIEINYPDSNVSFVYEYNPNGQVIKKETQTLQGETLSENHYTYGENTFLISDAKAHQTAITYDFTNTSVKPRLLDNNKTHLEIDYDAQGLLKSLKSDDLVAEVTHNAKGLISSIVTDANNTITYDYDETHNRPTKILFNETLQTLVYNLLGQVVASNKEKVSNLLSSSAYSTSSLTYYTYDEKGRLTKVTSPSGAEKSYEFASKAAQFSHTLPSIFDDDYETLMCSWNLEMNQAFPHSKRYYKGANYNYYDWATVDQLGFAQKTLLDKKYIYIGYSYGGDSVLALSNSFTFNKPNLEVEVLITIDPVGWVPTYYPTTQKWINVTAKTTMKTITSGAFKYVGRIWGIPQYRWVETEVYTPDLDEGDLLASSGGKETYAPLQDGLIGAPHEQINYIGHHGDFNCMLAEVSNRYPEMGLFKRDVNDSRNGVLVLGCYMGTGSITLVE